jgi:anti-anti-sigma regulatory factor
VTPVTINWAVRYPVTRRPLASLVEVSPVVPVSCRVSVQKQGDVAVYTLMGALVAATAPEVRVLLQPAEKEHLVLLDLADLTAIDQEGLAALQEAIRVVHEGGGRVAIARSWRQSMLTSGLVGSLGLVFVALSSSNGVAWLLEPAGEATKPLRIG